MGELRAHLAGLRRGRRPHGMDYVTGAVLGSLTDHALENRTLVFWLADNGPTTSEQLNAGSVGPFAGRWAADVIDPHCVVCPSSFEPMPTAADPRRCVAPGSGAVRHGIRCSADVGLGST